MSSIVSIQALRALAAIAVAMCHAAQVPLMLSGHPNDRTPFYSMASGVDLFFVISGFVMVYSSQSHFGQAGAASDFLIKRIARIVPLYWLTTVAVMLHSNITLKAVLCSLFFIPYFNSSDMLRPIHGVGWTLNYEIFFYLLFAVCIRWQKKFAVISLSVALAAIVLTGHFLQPEQATLLFWSDPMILEFVFGMWVAVLYGRRVTLPPAARLCLIAVAIITIWLSALLTDTDAVRVIVWGIPATVIFAAAVLGPRTQEKGSLAELAALLGGASYAIYLIHPLGYGAVMLAWRKLGPFPGAAAIVTVLAMILSIYLSILVFWFFERAATKAVRKHLTQCWSQILRSRRAFHSKSPGTIV
jgi:exopolysaccharide production protein ExoZ